MEALSNTLLGLGSFVLLAGLILSALAIMVIAFCCHEIRSYSGNRFGNDVSLRAQEVKRIISNSQERKKRWKLRLKRAIIVVMIGAALVWGGAIV